MRKQEWAQPRPDRVGALQTYHLPYRLDFGTMIRAINNIGYDVDNFNEQSGLITFHTGRSWRTWAGQDLSVLILERGPSQREVVVDGEKRWPLQIWDWGEVKSIAKEPFQEFETLLQSVDSSKTSVR